MTYTVWVSICPRRGEIDFYPTGLEHYENRHSQYKIAERLEIGYRNYCQDNTRNKINISEFKSKVSDNDIGVFTGDKGDFLMIDSFSVYHRGGFCEKNNRLMLRISFHTPDSIDMIDKINLNNNFRYLFEINKNNNNLSFFEKHILFYRPKILYRFKIPQFLILIYKMFHFKN